MPAARRFCVYVYVLALACIPLSILWGSPGFVLGLLLVTASFLYLRSQGLKFVLERMPAARRLTAAEAPIVDGLVREYARRLGIPKPTLFVLETRALNVGAYGFRGNATVFWITRGCFDLPRTELAALVSRQMTQIWSGQVISDSWMAQILHLVEISSPKRGANMTRARKYGPRFLLHQMFFLPLFLIPLLLLSKRPRLEDLDLKSVRLSRRPWALSEALRRLEWMEARFPLKTTLTTYPLFLVPPACPSPLLKLFFEEPTLQSRISAVQSLQHVVGLT